MYTIHTLMYIIYNNKMENKIQIVGRYICVFLSNETQTTITSTSPSNSYSHMPRPTFGYPQVQVHCSDDEFRTRKLHSVGFRGKQNDPNTKSECVWNISKAEHSKCERVIDDLYVSRAGRFGERTRIRIRQQAYGNIKYVIIVLFIYNFMPENFWLILITLNLK